MRSLHRVASTCLSALFGLLTLLAGCTDTNTVIREPFNPPPDESTGFLGYFTSSDQQTTCGNCHVLHQADWAQTAHAEAYARRFPYLVPVVMPKVCGPKVPLEWS